MTSLRQHLRQGRRVTDMNGHPVPGLALLLRSARIGSEYSLSTPTLSLASVAVNGPLGAPAAGSRRAGGWRVRADSGHHRAGLELAAIDPHRAAEAAADLEGGLDEVLHARRGETGSK